ncbi:MAG: Ig-like domain-containing protein [Gemmatimonadota bacterium]
MRRSNECPGIDDTPNKVMPGWSWGRTIWSVLLLAITGTVLSCTNVLNDLDTGSVDHVRISPDSMDLPVGVSGALQAFPLDASNAFHPGAATTWTTSDPSIVTVNDSGGILGVGAGTATVTATVLGIDGTSRVRVGPAPLIAFAIDSIHFDAQAGQPSPAAQTVAITNGGGLTLSGLTVGTIDYGTGPTAWLIPQFDSTTAPATLTLSPATGAITQAGTYVAIVPIAAPGAGNSPQNITVVVDVVPGPPTTYQMAITAGNGQIVQAGAAVPAAMSLTITDAFTNPIAGLPVTFQVTAGGGILTGTTTVNTDPAGVATAPSWTVQATGTVPADGRFINQLLATAPSAGSVTFTTFAYFSYTLNVHPIWAAQSCTGCHGNANLGGFQLNGTAAATYSSELFDVVTGCASGTIKQVATGGGIAAETASLLVNKLDNTAPAACPTPMPTSGILIPTGARDTIRAWVRAGAPLN